jgi:hypothetical protein
MFVPRVARIAFAWQRLRRRSIARPRLGLPNRFLFQR